MIEVVLYEDKNFITAGADGYIKWWPLADIDQAEGDEQPEVAIRPLKEVSISTPEGDYAHIVNMVKGKGMWLVQDAKGRLWQLDAKDYQATVVREFHQGQITDLAVSDSFNMCITTGENGLIKVWDYLRQVPLYQIQYKGRANCIDLLRRSDVNKGRIAAVGYDSGVIRIIGLGETKVEMASVFKAADTAIVKVKYCPAQSMLVTASEVGELFFFEVNGFSDLALYNPICLVRLP
jgi:WD40 repeat protein